MAFRQALAPQLVISLDFELHWGLHDHKTVADYRHNLEGERVAIEGMLRLFEQNDIAATWATVGLLFCNGREEALASRPTLQPSYTDRRLNPYPLLARCGDSEAEDGFHFAPSVIDAICSVRRQEMATHTFSHYCCLEDGQTSEQFRADLQAAKKVARKRGIDLRSIVFPRNQCSAEHLQVCADEGIAYFRGNQDSRFNSPVSTAQETAWRRAARLADAYVPLAGRPEAKVSRQAQLINIPASRFLRPIMSVGEALEPLRLRRILHEMRSVAQSGGVYHLWWHPHNFGKNVEKHLTLLEAILGQFRLLQHTFGMESSSMSECGALYAQAGV
jgi:hypothetical protein